MWYLHAFVAAGDSLNPEDDDFTQKQISRFYSALSILESDGINPGKVHVQSSYGLLNYPELKCDYVRVGIALYGVRSSLSSDEKHPALSSPGAVAQNKDRTDKEHFERRNCRLRQAVYSTAG